VNPAPVTVAVVSWNTTELLRLCLQSMEGDARAGLVDVWVVDNASTDGSPEMVAREFPWATLRGLDENLGFGRAVNLVARESPGEWIAPANADIEVKSGAIARLLARGRSNGRIGAVGPRLLLPDGRTQPSVQPFPTLTNALLLHSRLHKLSPAVRHRLCLRAAHQSQTGPVDWVTGAFLIVRRAAFDSVGGFDERHWMYAEDMDLCWRLRESGWEVWYEPAAEVRHVVSAAAREAFGDELEDRWLTATYAWMARRRGVPRARVTAIVNIAEATARLAVFTMLRRASGERWEQRRRGAAAAARAHRVGLMRRDTLARLR
jgi:N-acetylglucosaminyl-diphospho-decaprenol L-rhamnosyltransferase